MLEELKRNNKYIGLKQSLRAIEHGEAKKAIVAQNIAPDMYHEIIKKCQDGNVPIEYVDTMEELGKACGIDVGAAIVVLLDD